MSETTRLEVKMTAPNQALDALTGQLSQHLKCSKNQIIYAKNVQYDQNTSTHFLIDAKTKVEYEMKIIRKTNGDLIAYINV